MTKQDQTRQDMTRLDRTAKDKTRHKTRQRRHGWPNSVFTNNARLQISAVFTTDGNYKNGVQPTKQRTERTEKTEKAED